MYIKTLRIHGFKSFADRTRLELEPGVTVVVGPNGSGKSNIVDAVSWVLGTQGTKHLRTQKMEEVIFAGTSTRPRHQLAEVTLTFENNERLLPLDLTEVSISRRLHSDGNSDYEINNTPCRLLDIQELLSDGGVGRHQHVIVNQGQVASILNASPAEHRAIVEEAAGVLKHRMRRQRSVARLERTRADVQRLDDILNELRRQMRPLKRQANAASRYLDMRAEAKALRLYLAGEELRQLRGRLSAAGSERDEAAATRSRSEEELAGVEDSLAGTEAAAADNSRNLQHATAAAARLETTGERLRRIAQVARERLRSVTSGAELAGQRRSDLEHERAALTDEMEAAAAALSSGESDAERFGIELRALEDEERSLTEQESLSAEGVLAVLRGDLQALEASERRDLAELESLANRLEAVHLTLADTGVEEFQDEIRRLDKEAGQLQDAYQAAESARTEAQAAWEAAAAELAEANRAEGTARAYLEALEGSAAASSSVRLAFESSAPESRRIRQALDVPDPLVAAVASALGAILDGYVVDRSADLLALAQSAGGAAGIGRLALVGGDRAPDEVPARRVSHPALVDQLGPAADQVLASRLLGDVVLVDDIETGWEAVSAQPELRAVTRDGDLIGPGTIIVGAGRAGIEDAREAWNEHVTRVARAESRATTTERAFSDSRAAERTSLEALEQIEIKIAGATGALDRAERLRAEARGEADRLEARREALAQAGQHRTARIAEVRSRLAQLEDEEAAQQAAWESMQQRRDEVGRRRVEVQDALGRAQAAVAASGERRKLAERRLESIAAELANEMTIEATDEYVAALSLVEERARRTLTVVTGHVEALRTRQAALRIEASNLGTTLADLRDRRRELVATIDEAREALARLEVELEGLRVRDEAVLEALRRDADSDESQALAAPAVELADGVDAHAHLEDLDAKLRRMGPVNPLAAEEYASLEERSDFLEGQLADLHQSARELEKVIAALDTEMASLFESAFADIAGLFEENFRLLFPGGRGKLALTEPDDLLNTGIEITAQPLGKKVSRLSLLSGGERSLAALAFLFAVFRARPSPFYILDEVEAALDDANLHRFLKLVELLRAHAQVVIVTHQQQTMEAADVLYGITMEPGGSSQVVSKRMTEATV